jgi:hypothetical protein
MHNCLFVVFFMCIWCLGSSLVWCHCSCDHSHFTLWIELLTICNHDKFNNKWLWFFILVNIQHQKTIMLETWGHAVTLHVKPYCCNIRKIGSLTFDDVQVFFVLNVYSTWNLGCNLSMLEPKTLFAFHFVNLGFKGHGGNHVLWSWTMFGGWREGDMWYLWVVVEARQNTKWRNINVWHCWNFSGGASYLSTSHLDNVVVCIKSQPKYWVPNHKRNVV